MPVIEADMEAVQMLLATSRDAGHEFLRRDAGFLGRDHDRSAVRIVGADEIDFVPLHALEPHPDVSLDVFHDVTDVKRCIGVRQGGGDEKLAGRCGAHRWC